LAAPSAFIAAVIVELRFPDSGGLKSKRKELASTKALLNRRFGASVAEVDHQDLWQRSTLALSWVGSSANDLERLVDRVDGWLESRFPGCVRTERRVLSFNDIH
jgi:uncharacterized protein YlxP (DUF503 family)